MNHKVKNYVEALFSDIPRSKKSLMLKQELMATMSEQFEKYIQEGQTENQAYSLVISQLGDIDERLADVMPSVEFVQQANFYRKRNAKNIAIGVAMYIVGVAFLIGLGALGMLLGNEDSYGVAGLILLLLISAVATGIIIYTTLSTPIEYKDYDKKTKKEYENLDSKHGRLLENITTTFWIIVAFIYLMVSFITMRWDITWLIFVLAAIVDSIIKTIFEMRYSNEDK